MEQESEYILLTLYSPGKRRYKIVLENTEDGRACIEGNLYYLFGLLQLKPSHIADAESQQNLLEQVKKLGIPPEEDNIDSANDQVLLKMFLTRYKIRC